MRRSLIRIGAAFGALVALAATTAAPLSPFAAAPASAGVSVNGSGSTWSQIAIDQWRADVSRQGLTINYQGTGSTAGRQSFIYGQSDFAVSEIPFQGAINGQPSELEIPELANHPFAYLPIVAGGTSFLYHLQVNGALIRDLKLSGETVTKIFTGVIKNWNDPAITADDGRVFPSLAIRPVVRSDGSGTSAQFSLYMSKRYPALWNTFCAAQGIPTPCGQTSLYPIFSGSTGQPGSDGVTSFTTASYNNGAITYVEYGYAVKAQYPVVSLLNSAGFFVQPTAHATAIALTKARINPDRTQVLDDVYTNPDPRAYPLSSYSYMIVPTSTSSPFSTEKGAALGKFIYYFLCDGQQKAEPLGYSPLPKNLVQYGFDAASLIPGAAAPPPIETCNNPTITGSFVTDAAPPPPPTDKKGGGGATGGTGATGGSSQTTVAGAAPSGTGAATGTDGQPVVTAPVDTLPDGTVAPVGTAAGNEVAAPIIVQPITVSGHARSGPSALSVLAVLVLALALFLPPLVWAAPKRRRRTPTA